MKPGWEKPYAFVCDNVELAEFFIDKAKQDLQDLPRRWCVNIAAGALYSAYQTFNEKVATGDERVPMTLKAGTSQAGELVNLIRHGAVHFQQDQGEGATFAPGQPEPNVTSFWWVNTRHGQKEFPTDEVLSVLADVAELIRRHCFEQTHTWYLRFG